MLLISRWLLPTSATTNLLSPSTLLSHPPKPLLLTPHRHHVHQLTTTIPTTHFLKKSKSRCFALTTQEENIQQNGNTSSSSSSNNNNEEGPIELPYSITPIFATSDEPTPLQTATSVLLTGAITVFLFRSLRRRAKRAKETKFRSSGANKSLKEEAVESLKAVSLSPVSSAKTPPSPVQAFIGALTAGVIALILYKFTTTIEAALNRQTISDNYSVRQITVTIRTIINGLCYLATFVFGVNAFGLFLYSGQLAFNSLAGDPTVEGEKSASSQILKLEDDDNSSKVTNETDDQSSDNSQ